MTVLTAAKETRTRVSDDLAGDRMRERSEFPRSLFGPHPISQPDFPTSNTGGSSSAPVPPPEPVFPKWEKWTSLDGALTVEMPEHPTAVERPNSTGDPYGVVGQGFNYIVTIEKLPSPLVGRSPEIQLESLQSKLKQKTGIAKIDIIDSNGSPALAYIKADGSVHTAALIFVANGNSYTVSCMYQVGSPLQEVREEFLYSATLNSDNLPATEPVTEVPDPR